MKRAPVFLITIFTWVQLPAAILYVNQAATGLNTGESWENAFTDLQSALAIAQAYDEIWIAKGTYKPTSGLERSATFLIPNGVRLYGGFEGYEIAIAQRDWEKNLTILSGDIGVEFDFLDNVFHVVTINNSPDQAVLDGIQIIFGFADQSVDGAGGGVFINGTTPGSMIDLLIQNCQLEENYAGLGGGIGVLAINGDVRLQNRYNRYRYNLADSFIPFHRSGGGGIGVLSSDGVADIVVDHCKFENNEGYWTKGGGIYFSDFEENDTLQEDRLKVLHCQFENNFGLFGGGAISARLYQDSSFGDIYQTSFLNNGAGSQFEEGYGGALELAGFFNIKNCIFNNNGANNGGAIYFSVSKSSAVDCLFDGNGALTGGAIGGFADYSQFLNCTFFNNFAVDQGHIFSGAIEDSLYNCIFWDNSGLNPSNYFNGGGFYFEHCLWKLDTCPAISTQWTKIECGPGNLFNQSPRFISPQTGDFSLHRCSPAIDAGTDSLLILWGIESDIAGNPRVEGPRPDIGAYESPGFRVNLEGQSPACFDASDGWIDAQVENGAPPFTFQWSNDSTGLALSSLGSGLYSLTLTDSQNCEINNQIELIAPDSLVTWFRVADAGITGQPGGHILLDSIRGGTPPYTYLWNTGVDVASISGLIPGEYALTVTDEQGCQKIFDFDINMVSGVNIPETALWAKIYPNPSSRNLPATLHIAGWDGLPATVKISDPGGRVVWMQQLNPRGAKTVELPLPDFLPGGIYFIFIGHLSGPGAALKWVCR